MINIKTAASIAAGVAVAAASVQQIISRTRKDVKTPVEEAVESFYSPEFIAFNKAQDLLSDRMLSGYYDHVDIEDVRADYNVIYHNFLSK